MDGKRCPIGTVPESRLASILAEYFTRIDRGTNRLAVSHCSPQHPEHAAELQNYFDDVDLFERLTQDSANARSDSGPTTPRPFGDYESAARDWPRRDGNHL